MANIDLADKGHIEKTFKMGGGYVLDISNKRFQEIIYHQFGFDVYERYQYESKAKLLRRIIADESNYRVGKLLLEILKYRKEHVPFESPDEKISFNKSLELAYRLVGKVVNKKTPAEKTQYFSRSENKLFTVCK